MMNITGDRSPTLEVTSRPSTLATSAQPVSLPPRMLDATLVAGGFDITFLGPSLPAAQFARSLNEINPTTALLSCTNPINLPGARRTIEVAHDAGVSVIIGGRALDAGGVRAKALGADAWATNAAGAASILAS